MSRKASKSDAPRPAPLVRSASGGWYRRVAGVADDDSKEHGTPLDCITVAFADGSLDEIRILTDREHDRLEIVTLGGAESGGRIRFDGKGADGRRWQFVLEFGDANPKDEIRIIANARDIATRPIAALRNWF